MLILLDRIHGERRILGQGKLWWAATLASLACLTVMRASVELIVAGGNDKFKRPEACAWIGCKITTVFRSIKFINSYVENNGDCSGRLLIRIETNTGVC